LEKLTRGNIFTKYIPIRISLQVPTEINTRGSKTASNLYDYRADKKACFHAAPCTILRYDLKKLFAIVHNLLTDIFEFASLNQLHIIGFTNTLNLLGSSAST